MRDSALRLWKPWRLGCPRLRARSAGSAKSSSLIAVEYWSSRRVRMKSDRRSRGSKSPRSSEPRWVRRRGREWLRTTRWTRWLGGRLSFIAPRLKKNAREEARTNEKHDRVRQSDYRAQRHPRGRRSARAQSALLRTEAGGATRMGRARS